MNCLLSKLQKVRTQADWDALELEDYIGKPFYVINHKIETISEYTIKAINKSYNEFKSPVVQYTVGDEKIHSYTIGFRSGTIGERFQTDKVKVAKSFRKHYPLHVVDCIYNQPTKKLLKEIVDEFPEYFI